MPFQYACFISYRRGQHALVKRFIDELRKALEDYLEPYLEEKVFIDEGKIQAGDFYNQVMASSLCRSMCMIVVFTPTYFDTDHSYCAREYRAMELLEGERLGLLGPKAPQHGLIIPIVFRGPDELPPQLQDHRQFYDFSKYTLVQPEIGNNPDYASKIEEIARRIYDFSKELKSLIKDPCENCDTHKLPTKEDKDFANWLDGVMVGQRTVMPFPGR